MQESERIFIAENATLLRGSERELNRQLFTILNSIYDGLYITDGQANTILINRAYEEVSGLRREDVLGKSMQEIVATGMIDRSGSNFQSPLRTILSTPLCVQEFKPSKPASFPE